jgi:hypothetical protein
LIKTFPIKIPTNYTCLCGGSSIGGLGLIWGFSKNRNPFLRSAAAEAYRVRREPALKETLMKKTLTALVAAATIAVSLAAVTDASAQGRRAGAVAAGAAVGLVGGLIIGSAIANSRPAYVEPAPVYVAPAASCIVDQQVWSNRYQAWVVRPVRVPC